MQTATVEVKYVNPPKEGKQYGSIRDLTGTTWPVKADRIKEFAQGEKYEIAFIESDSGFRNLIGVKHLAVQPDLPRGKFSNTPAQRTNGAQRIPIAEAEPAPTKASTQEQIFATGGIYRDIEMGRVGTSENELVERVILWRNVYRRAFSE